MRHLLYTLPLALALIQSCRLPELKKECPAINSVKKGSRFMINLPESHAGHFSWSLASYDAQLVQQMNATWHGEGKGIDFNMEATAAGQTILNFIQRKYSDTTDIKCFIVKIIE